MVRCIIVGIDPGIVTGISILDSEGRVLYLSSKRDVKKSELIKLITKFGRPLLIATDVNPPPQSVEKFASILGSKLFFPEQSLSILEKQELIKEFHKRIKNNHEADSLAATIKAWKTHRELFSKVKNNLEKLGLLEFFDDVVIKLLKEGSDNIDNAVDKVLEEKRRIQPEVKIQKGLTIQEYESLVTQLQKQLKQKEEQIQSLIQQSNSLNKALTNAKTNLKIFEKSKLSFGEFASKKELEEIKKANEFLKKCRKIEEKNFEPIIEVEKIESSILEKINENIGLEDRIVFSNSMENLNFLNNFKIKVFLTKTLPKNIEKLEFPIILLEGILLKNFNGILAVKKDELENKLKEARKKGLVEWLKEYKRRKE